MLIPMLLIAAAAIEPPPTCNAFVQVSNPKVRIVEHDNHTLDLIVNGRKTMFGLTITKPFDELILVAYKQRKGKTEEEHFYSAYDVNTRYFDSILFKSDCHDKSE
jgi:hypothetical protein